MSCVLPCFVQLAGGAVFQPLSNISFQRRPVVRAFEKGVDFGMRQMEHAFVRVPDEEFLAGERDYDGDDGGRGVGRGVNPHVILKSLMLYLLQHCREVVVSLLGSNPRLESAWNVAFDFL
jgi:hypothetical protein